LHLLHRRAALRLAAIGAACAVAIAGPAGAADADPIPPAGPAAPLPDLSGLAWPPFRAEAAAPRNPAPLGFLDLKGPNLFGDLGGLRPALSNYGVTLTILENVETFGNLSGGVKQGFEADGLTTVTLQMDTGKAFGLNGGTLNASAVQYWGGNLTADNLMALQGVSDIEAPVGVRLWELWYQQTFGDRFDIKVGEQSLDEEFIIAPTGNALFLNEASGWPGVPTANLPGGGPAYPLAGLGVRARAKLTESVTLLAGVFNGSPIPRDSPNTATSNPFGVSFPLDVGTLAIAELQYAYGSAGSGKANVEALPGVYKIGAWWDSYKFDDLRTDTAGLPLASLASNGIPATHHGDVSLYGVVDQMVWRSKDNASRSLNVFVRPMVTPYQDRNLVSASFNAGVALHAPLPGRDNDSFGVEMGTVWPSRGATGFDRQMQVFQPSAAAPIRAPETFVEATYQFQALPSWQIQPDIQYYFNPGLGVANPSDPARRVRNAFVVGLRTNINF